MHTNKFVTERCFPVFVLLFVRICSLPVSGHETKSAQAFFCESSGKRLFEEILHLLNNLFQPIT